MTMMIMREKMAKEASTFAYTCLETICFLFYHNADHDHDHNDDDDDDYYYFDVKDDKDGGA